MMQQTKLLMGMPITIAIVDDVRTSVLAEAFTLFKAVDARFSTYKTTSEISAINAGVLGPEDYSFEMKEVLGRCDEAKLFTRGYFDIMKRDIIDPSGLVKGWSIRKVAELLRSRGCRNFFVDAGGDIVASGHNQKNLPWHVGIRHPKQPDQIAKTFYLQDTAIATSGNYERGLHLYNPFTNRPADELLSMTVIGADIETADVLATAAFVMGNEGIAFIESFPGYEAYVITKQLTGIATSNLDQYVKPS